MYIDVYIYIHTFSVSVSTSIDHTNTLLHCVYTVKSEYTIRQPREWGIQRYE